MRAPMSRAQSSTSQEIELTGIEARGRNGWFNPVCANVYRYHQDGDGRVHVWMWSKSHGQMPPILFVLPREDADKLGRAMLRQDG